MIIYFHAYYVLIVGVALWILFFFKPIIQCIAQSCSAFDQCLSTYLACLPCFHDSWQLIIRRCLITFCYVQPLFFCGIYILNEQYKTPHSSSVFLLDQHGINGSRYELLVKNNSVSSMTLKNDILKIDNIFFFIPFSFAVSICAMTWVRMIDNGSLTETTSWDENLEAEVISYEFLYYVELFMMNVSFLSLSCTFMNRILNEMFCLSLTLVLCVFCSQSRFHRERQEDNLFLSVLMMILFIILMPYFTTLVDTSCTIRLLAFVIHCSIIFVIVNFHFVANGNASAAQVLFVRVSITVISCVFFLACYGMGVDQQCYGNTLL